MSIVDQQFGMGRHVLRRRFGRGLSQWLLKAKLELLGVMTTTLDGNLSGVFLCGVCVIFVGGQVGM